MTAQVDYNLANSEYQNGSIEILYDQPDPT
jgi:hypothetical protein